MNYSQLDCWPSAIGRCKYSRFGTRSRTASLAGGLQYDRFGAPAERGFLAVGFSAQSCGGPSAAELAVHGIETVKPYRGVTPFLDDVATSSVIVNDRFHMLTECAVPGVPVVPLVYAEKMRDFCVWMGLPHITIEDTEPKRIRQFACAALDAGPVNLTRLRDRVDPFQCLTQTGTSKPAAKAL